MTLRASSHMFWSADGGPSDRGAGSGCGGQSGCLEADCGSCNCVPDSDIRREPRQCHGERSWTKSQLHKSSFGFGVFICVQMCVCSPQVEALQKESNVRGNYWREQTLKEEEMVEDFDRAVKHHLSTSEHESDCVSWLHRDYTMLCGLFKMQVYWPSVCFYFYECQCDGKCLHHPCILNEILCMSVCVRETDRLDGHWQAAQGDRRWDSGKRSVWGPEKSSKELRVIAASTSPCVTCSHRRSVLTLVLPLRAQTVML